MDYCTNSLSRLDQETMLCIVPYWTILLIVFFAAIITSIMVYVTQCIVTRCRDKRQDEENNIDDIAEFLVTAD